MTIFKIIVFGKVLMSFHAISISCIDGRWSYIDIDHQEHSFSTHNGMVLIQQETK